MLASRVAEPEQLQIARQQGLLSVEEPRYTSRPTSPQLICTFAVPPSPMGAPHSGVCTHQASFCSHEFFQGSVNGFGKFKEKYINIFIVYFGTVTVYLQQAHIEDGSVTCCVEPVSLHVKALMVLT